MLVTAALVFLMQAGFMCLESGFTRSKNSINVAIKNMTDFVVSLCIYWAWGFALMFGVTSEGLIGVTSFLVPFENVGEWHAAFFLFQAMFCATAATILSGAVAERFRYSSYTILAVLISGMIYPIFGHWVWNGADGLSAGGWLGGEGFVDFAGSTVVHSIGGWVALAALLVIGAREGRFPEDGSAPRKINGHSLPMSVLGALLLYAGWFGFNGGSTLALNTDIARIIANTALAGAFGGVTALTVGWASRGIPEAEFVINGSLAGLVAITANCHAVSAVDAALIGAIGGLVMLGCDWLLMRLRIDDAVGAVPVHLGAGVWGTLAVAIFGVPEMLGTGLTRAEQFEVQLKGVGVAALWAFGLTYLILYVFDKFWPMRVSGEDERAGLNFTEHGATTELVDLLTAMERQGQSGDLAMRVPVEPFTEVGQIAQQYNKVMDLLQRAVSRAESIVRDIGEGIVTFAEGGQLVSVNPGAGTLFRTQPHEVMGAPVTAFLTADAAGGVMTLDRIMRLGDRPEGATIWATRRDRSVFPADVRVSRSAVDGDALYTVLVKDVSERKRAEDALLESRSRMQRHNKALTALASLQHKHHGDVSGLIAAIMDCAKETLKIQDLSIWRYDATRHALLLVGPKEGAPALSGFSEGYGVRVREQSAILTAIQRERVLLVNEVRSQTSMADLSEAYLRPRNVTALMAAQIRMSGAFWGAILFEFGRGKREWFPEESSFAASVADAVTMAWDDDQRRKAEEEVLRMNEELEARVEHRTAELQHSNQELHETLSRLEKTQDHLVTAEKMAALGELVAGVAHEINTPVGVAVTAASHLQNKTQVFYKTYTSGQVKRSDFEGYLKTAQESSAMLLANLERASDLVQSFKKVAVDQSSEAMRPFKLMEYTREVLLSLRPKLKTTKHEVLVDGPEDLELRSYPGAYSQIVTNFITNSLMHGYDEDAQGTIRLHFETDGDDLLFVYSDDGKGIPEEHQKKIFDPFFTTRRGQGGSGLGLHILYNIITNQLGGTIKCESTVGEGTTFHIRIPIVRDEEGSASE